MSQTKTQNRRNEAMNLHIYLTLDWKKELDI